MATIKSEYYRFNGVSWDLHYFKTSIDMVDGLTSALAGKAASNHTHPWSDITSKPSWIGSIKPTYTAAEVGALPTTGGTINGNLGITGNVVMGGIIYLNNTVTSDNDGINVAAEYLNFQGEGAWIGNVKTPGYGHQAANKTYVDSVAGPPGVISVAASSLTLSSSHMNKFVYIVPTANPTTVTLNKVVSDDYPAGTEIHIMRWGTNGVTIGVGSGLTLLSIDDKKKISHNYGVVTLKKLSSTTWVLFGALSA